MKKVLLVFCLLLAANTSFGENRFGRPVIKMKDTKTYQFKKSDDIEYPTLSNDRFSVSCLVYRGTDFYYVEVNVTNKTGSPVFLSSDFVSFDKPGYSVYRGDTMTAAREIAADGDISFTPTPAPYVPPTYNTTINATATTYGNQTEVSGTATTTADYSGQAWANVGNALGNAIAARRVHNFQRTEIPFAYFLATHAQTGSDTALQPGESRSIVATFQQAKRKKKPFEITLRVGADTFRFVYKE